MIILKKICISLILLIIVKTVSGQVDLVSEMYDQFDVHKEKVSFKSYTANNNEAELVASFLFLFYKEFVSSQDMDVCVFTPSCSVYAMESVKEYGLIEGILNALDRSCRCHTFAGSYYPVNPETHKYHDPIEKKK